MSSNEQEDETYAAGNENNNADPVIQSRQKSGKFSREETEKVRKAVEDYCAMKQISVGRLCSECDHKAELKGAWMEIAKHVPGRSVQSVYRHGLRQLHPFKRGAWTDEECETLHNLVQRMGKKWAAIQVKLNRSADSCRDKHREMSEEYVRGRWKENETETLKKLIREHLSADPSADIKELGKMVEAEGLKIPWSSISKRMEKRSRLSCFKKWQKMTGLFSPSDSFKKPSNSSDKQGKGDPAASGAATGIGAVVNNPIRDSPPSDYDAYLLSELISLNATRESDVDWEAIRLESAQERWNELLEEYQSSDAMDDSMLSLPLSELARMMLERKASAEQAAETVEAVDLPAPEALNSRVELPPHEEMNAREV
eukprot:scaffold168_cov124-Cylindrotheca_fusiformis.AAC.24